MKPEHLRWGYRWRSSTAFILFVVILAQFCETFLYSFPVPILSYMLEERLHVDPSQTQNLTTSLLSFHGLIALISAPVIAHYADKSSNRKTPFLISLAGCFVGTIILSLTPSLPALFVGRIIQGIAGSATLIVSSAMLTDHVEVRNLGKFYGLSMSFVSAGVVAGPAVAGAILQLAGYWIAWSVPLALLILDIAMRFIMIEGSPTSTTCYDSTSTDPTRTIIADTVISPLLASGNSIRSSGELGVTARGPHEKLSKHGFYSIMLSDARVIVGLSNTILSSSLLASFDTTLTLHLRDTFGWGTLAIGMMFLSLQLPFIFLGSLAGWLRDRVGLRYPTTVGWALLAPVMWLLGLPGTIQAGSGSRINQEALFIFAIIAFGAVAPFVRGAGYLQLTIALNEFQDKEHGIFGDHDGSNRVFALQDIALSLGLMVGPLLSGSLSQAVGYYWMSVTFAILCLLSSIASISCLSSKLVTGDEGEST